VTVLRDPGNERLAKLLDELAVAAGCPDYAGERAPEDGREVAYLVAQDAGALPLDHTIRLLSAVPSRLPGRLGQLPSRRARIQATQHLTPHGGARASVLLAAAAGELLLTPLTDEEVDRAAVGQVLGSLLFHLPFQAADRDFLDQAVGEAYENLDETLARISARAVRLALGEANARRMPLLASLDHASMESTLAIMNALRAWRLQIDSFQAIAYALA
jgi:hypothetical protein